MLPLECPDDDEDDEDESDAELPDNELEEPAERLEIVFVNPPKEPPKECPIDLIKKYLLAIKI